MKNIFRFGLISRFVMLVVMVFGLNMFATAANAVECDFVSSSGTTCSESNGTCKNLTTCNGTSVTRWHVQPGNDTIETSDVTTYAANSGEDYLQLTAITSSTTVTCARGKYLVKNAVSSTGCTTCPAGHWCPGGTWNPQAYDQGKNACPSGTYRYGSDQTSESTACRPCSNTAPANATFNTAATSSTCPWTCNSGYTKNSAGTACVGNTYTIVFNNNGGSGGQTTSKTVTYGSAMPTPITTPTRTGYAFAGYYDTSAATGGTQYYALTGGSARTWDKTSSATLYARWKPNTYSITLDAKRYTSSTATDGTSATTDVSPTKIYEKYNTGWYRSTITVSGNSISSVTIPTLTGYTFGGFWTGKTGTGTQVIDSSGNIISGKTATFTSNSTLYAKWEPNKYKITVKPNGATSHTSDIIFYEEYGSKFTNTSGGTITTLPGMTRTGYAFKGFYTAASGGTQVMSGHTLPSNTTFTSDTTLYAQWAPVYTITLNYNDGSNSSTTINEVYGEKWTNSSGTPITNFGEPYHRLGYEFDGWYTAASGGIQVIPATGVLPSNTTFTSNTTLYAHWRAMDGITVDFLCEDGSTPIAPSGGSTILQNFTCDDIKTPMICNGRYVEGWTDDYYVATVTNSDLCSIINDQNRGCSSCYVVYTATVLGSYVTSTVTLNANGGSGGTSSVTATYGSAMPTITTPTLTGYTFAGYYDTSAATGGTQYYTSTGASARTWNKTSATTLYARWTPVERTVTFNANGGAGTMATQTFTYGVAQNLTANTFTRSGYTFAGWNTAANGTGTAYADKATISNLLNNITLYAQWSANCNKITVDDFCSPLDYAPTLYKKTDVPGWYSDSSCNTALTKVSLPDKCVTSKSYTFRGLYSTNVDDLTADGNTGTQYFTKSGDTTTAGTNWTVKAPQTIYVGWAADCDLSDTNATCSVSVGDTGAVDYTTSCKSGYTINSSTNNTYKPTCTGNTIIVDYNENGGTAITNGSCVYGDTLKLPLITRNGFTFKGWKLADDTIVPANSSVACTVEKLDATSDVATRIIAQWTKDEYTITYNLNGGTNNASNPAKYSVDTDTITLADASKTGYTFGGWYSDANFTTKVTQITKGSTGNKTFWAKWTIMSDECDAGEYLKAGETSCTTCPAGYACAGGTFSYDSTKDQGINACSGATQYQNQSGQATCKTVSDGYYKKDNTAQTECDKGYYCKNAVRTQCPNGGTTSTTTSDSSDDCYKANMSCTVEHGSGKTTCHYAGTDYTNCDPCTVDTCDTGYTVNTNKDACSAIKRTVTFNANGGNGTMATQTFIYGVAQNLTANAFTRTGYTFNGWNTVANGSGTAYADKASISNLLSDITLYAQWEQNQYIISYACDYGDGTAPSQTTCDAGTECLLANSTCAAPAGYMFSGWKIGNNTIDNFTDINTVLSAGTYTATAQYEEIEPEFKMVVTPRTSALGTQVFGIDDVQGTFLFDCGNGESFAFFASYDTSSITPACTYSKYNQEYEINIASVGNPTLRDTNQTFITRTGNIIHGTNSMITKLGGSLGALFGGHERVDFSRTFASATNLTEIEDTLLDGFEELHGAYAMFSKATKLPNIPLNLLTPKNGCRVFLNGAKEMFISSTKLSTVTDWDGNETSYLPASLYERLSICGTVDQYTYAFYGTALADTCPAGMYEVGKIGGKPACAPCPSNSSSTAGATSCTCNDGYNYNGGTTTTTNACSAIERTVTFNANGGAGSMSTQTFTYGVAQNLTANAFTRTGYAFGGWNTASDGSGTAYADKASISNLLSDITLYAQWSQCPAGSYCPGDNTVNTCPSNSSSEAGATYCTCWSDFTTTGLAGGNTQTTTEACKLVPEFTITTTNMEEDWMQFSIAIEAIGKFYIDWGDGSEITVIDNKTGDPVYPKHIYSESGVYKIKISGQATGYKDDMYSAIRFNGEGTPYIAKVEGSLGAIFGGQAVPYMFRDTFRYQSNMTEIPSNLFDGVTGSAEGMFWLTFSGCESLKEIPVGLFKGISDGADYMFHTTFGGCQSLKSIPEHLFDNIANVGDNMFFNTFGACTSLESIPSGLFSNVISVSDGSFSNMFQGCVSLQKLPNGLFKNIKTSYQNGSNWPVFGDTFEHTGVTGFVPTDLFPKKDEVNGTLSMSGIFDYTDLLTVCPAGMYQYITGYESDWDGKVSCAPCPNGTNPDDIYCPADVNPALYKVTLDPNGGEKGSISALYGGTTLEWPYSVYYINTTADVAGTRVVNTLNPEHLPTRPGYNFAGFLDASGTQYISKEGVVATGLPAPTEPITLYAQWEAKTISCNAGTYLPANSEKCEVCPAGSYCEYGKYKYSDTTQGINECPTDASNRPVNSEQGAGKVSECFVTCPDSIDIEHGTTSVKVKNPTYYDSEYPACRYLATCETGYSASGADTDPTCSQNEYFVVFMSNGGTGTMPQQERKYNDNASLTLNTFTRAGYSFTGWNTHVDGSGTAYADGASGNLSEGRIESDANNAYVYLYAQWEPDDSEVTLDPNGGVAGTTSVTATYGEAMPKVSVLPTRQGYEFTGFFDSVAGGTKYYNANGTSARVWNKIGSQTLYAQWKAKTFTVKYFNGDTLITTQSCTFDSSCIVGRNVSTPVSKGHTFAGWTDSDKQKYANGADIKNIVASGEFELYAEFEPNAYIVEFNGNGADSGTMAKQDRFYGDGESLNENQFARTGYTFVGWNTSSYGSGTSYADKATGDLTSANNVTIVLYAQWMAAPSEITLDPNGGVAGTTSVIATYGAAMPKIDVLPTRAGYTFAGFVDANNTKYYNANGTSARTWNKIGSYTLTAQWTECDQNYYCPGDNVAYRCPTDASGRAVVSEMGSDSAEDCYATCSVKNIANGTTSVVNAQVQYDGTTYPACEYTTECDTGYHSAGSETAPSCAANTYTVEFDGNGATGGTMAPQSRYFNDGIRLTDNAFAKLGYEFQGWTTESNGGGKSVANRSTENLTDEHDVTITLYAKWTAATLSCNPGFYLDGAECKECVSGSYCEGGEWLFQEGTVQGMETCPELYPDSAAKSEKISDCKITCEAGYYVGKQYAACEPVGAGFWIGVNTVGYGELSKRNQCLGNTTTIGYGAGADEADDCGRKLHINNEVLYLRKSKKTAIALNVKVDGVTYYGNMRDCGDITISDNAKQTLRIKHQDKVYSVYDDSHGDNEQCQAIKYTVSYELNGGTDKSGLVAEYDVKQTTSLKSPVRDNSSFAGWYDNPEFTGSAINKIVPGTVGNLKLYAKWSCKGGYVANADSTACVGNRIIVNFNEDGGTAMANSSCEYGKTFVLPEITSTKAGAVVNGYKLANGTVASAGDTVACTYTNLGKYVGESTAVIIRWSTCAAGSYCPGDNTSVVCPTDSANRTVTSPAGSDSAEDCYAKCANKTITGGKATLVAATQGYDGKAYPTCMYNVTCNTGYTVDETPSATPQCIANEYTVEYRGNGSDSGQMSVQQRTYNDGKTLTPNSYDKVGYSFSSWNTEADGTGTSYTDKKSGNLTSTDGDKIVLNAQWSADEYVVTYACGFDGGKAPVKMTAVHDAEFVPAQNTCVNPGYMFAGWQTTDDKGASVTYPANVGFVWNYTSNKTFTAIWTPETISIDYAENGGGDVANNTCVYGETLTLPSAPTKFGYNFNGWKFTNGVKTAANATTVPCEYANVGVYTGTALATAQWVAKSIECAAGTYLPANSETCETCTAGYACAGGKYSYDANKIQGRELCTGSTYATSGATTCSACPDGYSISLEDADAHDEISDCKITCKPGTRILKGASECTACSAYGYCPGGEYGYDDTKDQGYIACPTSSDTWITPESAIWPKDTDAEYILTPNYEMHVNGWSTSRSSIGECTVSYHFEGPSGRGRIEGVRYNTKTGKYDTGGNRYFDAIEPGYYVHTGRIWPLKDCHRIAEEEQARHYVIYRYAETCPEGYYCPGYDEGKPHGVLPRCNTEVAEEFYGKTMNDNWAFLFYKCPADRPYSPAGSSSIDDCTANPQ